MAGAAGPSPMMTSQTDSMQYRRVSPQPEELVSKHMNPAKHEEWTSIAVRTKPLQLLDLPVDVLQAILREVTHTNDLTALALTHSSLHNVVIPHIYSRFDIVWPEASAHVETRVGVDALTYGLATLVMASDVFGEPSSQHRQAYVSNTTSPEISERPRRIRRGNHFAHYTRKFSLGNGPPDWVQEYLITKEGGKMLGTLVALAVGRMRNLEAFIWDMPTGVLRDVWLALASLGNRDDSQACRLEKVWVRWHDNSDQGLSVPLPHAAAIQPPQAANVPSILTAAANTLFQIPPYPRVEFPTFSILPPLKSLSVLEIDELPYAEEMSVLIERSLPVLRELRVGLAEHAEFATWAWPSEDRALIPPPLMMPVDSTVLRPGGVLGILASRFCDHFQPSTVPNSTRTQEYDKNIFEVEEVAIAADEDSGVATFSPLRKGANEEATESQIQQLSQLMAHQNIDDFQENEVPSISLPKRAHSHVAPSLHARGYSDVSTTLGQAETSSRKLRLDSLELERVFLSTRVFSKAIDWSRLMSLTLLGCRNHETLWKELRKQFTPAARLRTTSSSSRSVSTSIAGLFSSSRNSTPSSHMIPADDYTLKLKRLHTDSVSTALIAFIKDALAPDSLEWLFLQENASYKSTVSVETIYRGAIRRHRGSLKKFLLDSEIRKEGERFQSSWKRWIANRELLTCITSGKMSLRELSISIDYKDWHFFLQRLPGATHLRSLHIAHIAEHVHGTVDSREAALQVLDIVSLRRDLELCYLGIQRQCFEVLECTSNGRANSPNGDASSVHQSGIDSDDNDDATEDHNVHLDSDLEMSSEEEETEDEGQEAESKASFRLREILFYDDKVSIFRARHGKL